jgi:hypothetical protein
MALNFTDADVSVINIAQATLRANRGHAESADEGRLAQAISVAADALFDVLNVANAHGVKPLTYEQLHGRPDPAKVSDEDVPF